jgi:uncharacterized protein
MLIGIISDSHDHVPHVQQAVRHFRDQEVDLVLHAGDYCSPFMIPHFEGLPLKGIFGNNDGDKYLLMQKFREIEADLEGDFMELMLDGTFIAVYHGTYPSITGALRECGRYDIVISGHTHEKDIFMVNSTLAINPGTAHGFGEGATIAMLNTESKEVQVVSLGED